LTGDDQPRCWWPGTDELYITYHDNEWGRPTVDDTRLFEKACLEGFQSGLSWITILRKRENFREAFQGFDVEAVAGFDGNDVNRLLVNAGIVRHRRKIESTINNAQRAIELADEWGSLAAYFWSFEPSEVEPDVKADANAAWAVPAVTSTSTRLSKDLKSRGWTWVGPTTMYAFMQAMGLVNDHVEGCQTRPQCATERAQLTKPTSPKTVLGQ